jgi:hypothetical protein
MVSETADKICRILNIERWRFFLCRGPTPKQIIQAEGEFQAAEKLTIAAGIMSKGNMSLQLRYLETLKQISSENNSTILFPMPIDFLKAFGR